MTRAATGNPPAHPAPMRWGRLIRDAERLLDRLAVRDCVFVGLSLGGLVAQGLAIKRLDLVRGMVLSNTAVKIGTPQTWAARIAEVRSGGIGAIADAVTARWFTRRFLATEAALAWRARLCAASAEGYMATAAAIGGADLLSPTSGLTLPTLVIAGSGDGSTPPDLVRETADLIRGAQFELIRGAGHLPPVDQPEAFACRLAEFLVSIGHS